MEKETGFTLGYDKYNWDEHPGHFILEDCTKPVAVSYTHLDVYKRQKWGFTALPAVKEGGDRYSYTWFEQAWIPAAAEHQDLAKQFIAYLYSDEAAAIFAKAGAIQPIVGLAETLEGDNKMFYSIYDNGAKAALGSFAATEAIEGLDTRSVWFDPVNSLVTGDKTEQDWIDGVKAASDQLRAALK